MKLAYLIAGAGGMYCGSCLRDNRLAATLIERGRDVALIPLYTPIRTDEVDATSGPVFYGGINVFLQQTSSLFRHTPNWFVRLLDRPMLVRTMMRLAGGTHPSKLGSLTVSMLRGAEGSQRRALHDLVEGLQAAAPDVINLPNLMFTGMARTLKEALRVPVVCTLSGEDAFLDKLQEPDHSRAMALIRENARHIDAFVSLTQYYADFAAKHFDLPRDRVHMVPMGIKVDDFNGSAGSAPSDSRPFTIGYLARICEEKGLHQLCDAFVQLHRAGRNCRLRVAGYLGSSDRGYLKSIRRRLRREGVAHSFEYVGSPDREGKLRFLSGLDVFSVPTVYREAKGIFVLEALASRVPVVQPKHGSFPELLEATGGGLLYDPSDEQALAATLARLMDDAALGARLGAAGCASVRERFTDTVMADRAWSLCEQVLARAMKEPTPLNTVDATIKVDAVGKVFPTRSGELVVLSNVSFDVRSGESAVIMGPSGCGKSTLLNIIGTLELPSGGSVRIGGSDPFSLSEADLAKFRNHKIGFVFQQHHLLPQCSVLENVLISSLADRDNPDRLERAKMLLERVGLSDRLDHRPAELSGGERQRVVIARALINEPEVLLADEPTGNLDGKTATSVADLLVEVHRENRVALVVVTHSETLARRFDARWELSDGTLTKQ